MVEDVRSSPGGFRRLIERGVFVRTDEDGQEVPINHNANPELPPAQAQAALRRPVAALDDDSDDSGDDSPSEESVPPPSAPIALPVDENVPPVPIVPVVAADATERDNSAVPIVTEAPDLGVVEPAPTPAPLHPAPVPPPPQVFTRICRDCAHNLFIARLYDWWANERADVVEAYEQSLKERAVDDAAGTAAAVIHSGVNGQGVGGSEGHVNHETNGESNRNGAGGEGATAAPASGLEEKFDGLPIWALSKDRKDCEHGRNCGRQYEPAHAKECELRKATIRRQS